LPDALKGHSQYLTDRVDGLITDAMNSPFTKNILPYVYLENPNQKLKWNVYSFDEGIASRVPYEAAARVLPQTKRSFAGYTVRQGLAIAMEHNFMDKYIHIYMYMYIYTFIFISESVLSKTAIFF